MPIAKLSYLCGCLAACLLLGCAKEQTAPAAEYPKSGTSAAQPPATDPAASGVPTTTSADPIAVEPAPAIDPAQREPLTDAQILYITDTINSGEVDQATVAKQKAKSPAVKKFANQMIAQHKQAKQQGQTLAKQTKLDPTDSASAAEAARKGTQTLDSLRAADPESFDRVYMESQVTQHQDVLDDLDKHLIPSASNAKLKAELQKSRTMVDSHLTQAKKIQQDL
jgi:putative membrane protein